MFTLNSKIAYKISTVGVLEPILWYMDKNITPWLEDQLQMLLSATTKEDLLDGLARAANLLEFDYFAYGLRLALPVSSPKIELVNNYPVEWQETYSKNNYLAIDPTVKIGLKTIKPIVWAEDVFANARPLWDDVNSFGISHGWAQSTYSSGGVSGMLTLSRSHDALSKLELLQKTPLLVWFNQLAQAGLKDILLPEMTEASTVKLTARETEIIRWTADGKTAYEISIILGIAERTVNFHLNNILNKFNVNSKIAATVQAVLLGLI